MGTGFPPAECDKQIQGLQITDLEAFFSEGNELANPDWRGR